jgi:peptidoglycan/LPS O-acetylase OafA/YrhL
MHPASPLHPALARVVAGRLSDFDPQENGITAVRLALALAVLISHAVVIGGFGDEPSLGHRGPSLGFVAVIGFFALSGFLLARSRERTSTIPFLRNQALRILPGYWLAVAYAALVAVPIGAAMHDIQIAPAMTLGWIGDRVLFIPLMGPDPLSPAFGGGAVNGSLWTLTVEISCYVVLAVVPVRWLRPLALGELAIFGLAWLAMPAVQSPNTALLLSFTFGVVAWMSQSPPSPWISTSWRSR